VRPAWLGCSVKQNCTAAHGYCLSASRALPVAQTSARATDTAHPPSTALQRPARPRSQTPARSTGGARGQDARCAPGSSGAALADRDGALGGNAVHRAAHGALAGEARDGLRAAARARASASRRRAPPPTRARHRSACRPAAGRAAGKRAAAQRERAAMAARPTFFCVNSQRGTVQATVRRCPGASAFGRRRPRGGRGARLDVAPARGLDGVAQERQQLAGPGLARDHPPALARATHALAALARVQRACRTGRAPVHAVRALHIVGTLVGYILCATLSSSGRLRTCLLQQAKCIGQFREVSNSTARLVVHAHTRRQHGAGPGRAQGPGRAGAAPAGKPVGVGSQAARSTGSEPNMKRPSGAEPQNSGCAAATPPPLTHSLCLAALCTPRAPPRRGPTSRKYGDSLWPTARRVPVPSMALPAGRRALGQHPAAAHRPCGTTAARPLSAPQQQPHTASRDIQPAALRSLLCLRCGWRGGEGARLGASAVARGPHAALQLIVHDKGCARALARFRRLPRRPCGTQVNQPGQPTACRTANALHQQWAATPLLVLRGGSCGMSGGLSMRR
jgi:hypothetical protein